MTTTATIAADLAATRAALRDARALAYNASQMRHADSFGRLQDEIRRLEDREDALLNEQRAIAAEPNPIVSTTKLRAYPGWVVREYADGTYAAADTRSPALTPLADSFREAVAAIRDCLGYRPKKR